MEIDVKSIGADEVGSSRAGRRVTRTWRSGCTSKQEEPKLLSTFSIECRVEDVYNTVALSPWNRK